MSISEYLKAAVHSMKVTSYVERWLNDGNKWLCQMVTWSLANEVARP